MNQSSHQNNAKLVYLLLLLNILVQFLGIIGVVIAYVNRDKAPDWLKSHYTFQIYTFWIGLIWLVIGGSLAVVGLGFFILLGWVIWLLIRGIKGIKYLDNMQPHPDPTNPFFP